MKVLVTGVTGYIGSHTAVELLAQGHDLTGIDDFSTSSSMVKQDIERVAGRPFTLLDLDLRNRCEIDCLLASTDFDAIIHFAGRKFVGESVADPMRYYERNLSASVSLAAAAQRHDVPRLVFSSSCTVYGQASQLPVTEQTPIAPVSPYGRTKAMTESVLEDLCAATPSASILALRYFNPIGAHPSTQLGEVPTGPPNNLLPYIMQVAKRVRPFLKIFGGDYDTHDGTCLRDYIHVVDLARAHVLALDHVTQSTGFDAINLGTGVGSSVLDVLEACEAATGRSIPHQIVARREGDAEAMFADPSRARQVLGWKAEADLAEMCIDHWNFEQSLGIQSLSA